MATKNKPSTVKVDHTEHVIHWCIQKQILEAASLRRIISETQAKLTTLEKETAWQLDLISQGLDPFSCSVEDGSHIPIDECLHCETIRAGREWIAQRERPWEPKAVR